MYLPGYTLPDNLHAEACVEKAVKGASILVFVTPHQFIGGLCEKICQNVAPDCIGVSLIKGLDFDDNGLVLISDLISSRLGACSSHQILILVSLPLLLKTSAENFNN